MLKTFLIVGTGGFIGSGARFLMHYFMVRNFTLVFPLSTFLINIIGCFAIGVIYALSIRGTAITPEWRFFLATGICGGFTTFSTFSYESITLFKDGNYAWALVYIIGSVLVGLLATIGGIGLVNSLVKV